MKTAMNSIAPHMTRNPVSIDPGAGLDDALRMLEEYGFRHLPVVEADRVVGILSDRNLRLATSLLPERRRLRDREGHTVDGPKRVSEIMSAPVHCVECDVSASQVAKDMVRLQIGAVVIVEGTDGSEDEGGGKILGIVTETNLLQAFVELCEANRGSCDDLVRYHMHRPLACVSPDTGIEEALDYLDSRIAHLGVTEGEKLLGILSERDLMMGISRETIEDAKAQAEGKLRETSLDVSSVMTRQVLTVEPGDGLAHAARILIGHQVSALPVLADGEPIGIVTQRGILEYYSSLGQVSS